MTRPVPHFRRQGGVLHLGEADLLTAFADLDAVGFADESLRRAALNVEFPDAASGSRCTGIGGPASGLVLLHDERIGGLCVLPAAGLTVLRAACHTALAARELLVARVATAAVVGAGSAVVAQLTALALSVANLSEVVVCPARGHEPGWPTGRLARHAAEQGIALSFTRTAQRALLGADLVVLATGATAAMCEDVDAHLLARGALLVNATGSALPARLARRADQIFVDAPIAEGGRVSLGRLLHGEGPGRLRDDSLVVVDLFGPPVPDVALASRLHEIALRHGLGGVLDDLPRGHDTGEGTDPCVLTNGSPC